MQPACCRIEAFDEGHRFCCGGQKIGFFWRQGFKRQCDAQVLKCRQRSGEHRDRVVCCQLERHAGFTVALGGRSENHDLSTEIPAKFRQCDQVTGSAFLYLLVRTREMVALRFGEQPVKSDHLQPGTFCLIADLFTQCRCDGRRL